MKKKENITYDFNVKLHRIGRIWTSIGVLMLFSVPVIMGLVLKTAPDWSVFANGGVIGLILLNLGAGLVEVPAYSSIIGTNGAYLAFITGNLSNLKIPCVVRAQEIAGSKIGTEENELVSTISIAVSSLVTVLIIAIIVMCLAVSGLQSVIEANPFITPAFGCVVYALFGSLGGKYLVKKPKLAVFPALIVVGLSAILAVSGISLGTPTLFLGIAVTGIFAYIQYKREKKKLDAEKLSGESAAALGADNTELFEQIIDGDGVDQTPVNLDIPTVIEDEREENVGESEAETGEAPQSETEDDKTDGAADEQVDRGEDGENGSAE